ncbi:hypothetical protein ACR2XN_28765 [Klebsiella pneumoniae]
MIDLIPFKLGEFDVILGMDWLSSNGAQIDCAGKKVRLKIPEGKEVVFKGQRQTQKFLTMIQAKRLLRKGREAYLAHVVDTQRQVPNLKDIPVINEFEDVLPEDRSIFLPLSFLETCSLSENTVCRATNILFFEGL